MDERENCHHCFSRQIEKMLHFGLGLGIPVELAAADVRPYFEHQKLLGRIPVSDFAPHILDEEQQLPFSLPTDQPRDNWPNIPTEVEGTGPTTPATESVPAPAPALEPHALQPPVDVPPVEELPIPVEPVL